MFDLSKFPYISIIPLDSLKIYLFNIYICMYVCVCVCHQFAQTARISPNLSLSLSLSLSVCPVLSAILSSRSFKLQPVSALCGWNSLWVGHYWCVHVEKVHWRTSFMSSSFAFPLMSRISCSSYRDSFWDGR